MKRSKTLLVMSAAVTLTVIAVAVVLLLQKPDRTGPADPPVIAEPLVTADAPVTADELPGPARAGNLRLTAWNVRNFPVDERPQDPNLGYSRTSNSRDLEVIMSGLDSDLFALSEIRDTAGFTALVQRACGADRYRMHYAEGGGRHGQHLTLAPDVNRLLLSGVPVEIPELSMDGSLRPGFAAYFTSTAADGADFSVLTVHLAAAPRGYPTRLQQYQIIADWVESWVAEVGDEDVIVLGDFNTTGAEGGSSAEELVVAERILGMAGLERLPGDLPCTEYWEGPGERDGQQIPSLLDHIWVRSLEEMDRSIPVQVWLHCRRHACTELRSIEGAEDSTFWDVSDHCPLTFEIQDQDLD